MTMPGIPAAMFDDTADTDHAAQWLLDRIDASPDRLAFIGLRITDDATDDANQHVEDQFAAAYHRALAERGNLGHKLLCARDVIDGQDRAKRIIIVVHEHQWIGGQCIRGCGETRPSS